MTMKDIETLEEAFFKPAEVEGCYGMIFENVEVQINKPYCPYGANREDPNAWGVRDEAVAEVSVFKTAAQLNGTEPVVPVRYRIVHSGIIRALRALGEGEATIGVARKATGKNMWKLMPVAPENKAKIVAVYEARRAAEEALLAEMP